MSKERHSGGVGKVFLGIFLGFILTLGSIVGLGCFVYFKGSVSLLNKMGIHVDTGSDKLNSMTIKDIVSSGVKVLGNTDSMSLNDVAAEFGYNMKTEVFGIDVSDVVNEPISNLSTAIENKFKTISAYEIEGVLDLSSINGVLNSKRTFYVSNGKLYENYNNGNYSNVVDFDYTIINNQVKVKNFDDSLATIVDNKVELTVRYLPLTYAIADVQNNTVAEVLNLTYDETIKTYRDSNNEPVSSLMAVLAPKKVSELTTAINNLTIVDLLGNADAESSIFSLVDGYKTKTITELTSSLGDAVNNAKIGVLIDKNVLDFGARNEEIKTKIGDKTLSEIIIAYINTL